MHDFLKTIFFPFINYLERRKFTCFSILFQLIIFDFLKVGAFLASQSDDRTIRVWRTKDWGCEKVISEPFDECGGTTHVLRLSWSPDGLYLVSAHAMNGGRYANSN